MSRKLFTLEEATLLLPVLRQEIRQLQHIKQDFDRLLLELRQLKETEALTQEEQFTRECELDFKQMEARMHIRTIFETGAQLKDIEQGLIDFPSRMEEKDILLCWRADEDSIAYYHGVHDGFQGRRPLEEI